MQSSGRGSRSGLLLMGSAHPVQALGRQPCVGYFVGFSDDFLEIE
jgi:hypothetical protein